MADIEQRRQEREAERARERGERQARQERSVSRGRILGGDRGGMLLIRGLCLMSTTAAAVALLKAAKNSGKGHPGPWRHCCW